MTAGAILAKIVKAPHIQPMIPTSIVRAAAVAAVVWIALSTASAADLVMYRTAGCPWCAAWDRQIGPIYPKTEVGQRLPVRMADLYKAQDVGVALQRPVRYSPTFVVADGGHEIGRIEGYPGEDFFWGLLDQLVLKLPPPVSAAAPTH
jgi:hypothetical protein